MLSLYRTLSLRYLRQRWGRTLLVVASIALGVATLVATQSLNECMARAGQVAVNPLAGVSDLQITNGDFGVAQGLAEELRAAAVPGVVAVRPVALGRVALTELANQTAQVLGVELESTAPADNAWGVEVKVTNPLAVLSGKRPVFVGSELAGRLPGGVAAVRVRAAGQERSLTGWGTVDARGPMAALGGSVLVMHAADAAELLGRPGYVSRLDLVLAAGADAGQVKRDVEGVLAGRAEARTPEAGNESIQDAMAGLKIGFAIGGAGALVVGLFLVYNALAVSVTERRHDIGVMRSLGATRGQVAGLFAGEAFFLGLAGSALGIPLGLGLARLALGPMRSILSDIFLPLQADEIYQSPYLLFGAALAGVLTALAAAFVPALQAASEEPADAVRRVPATHGLIYRAAQAGSSLLLIGVGLGGVFLRDYLPPRYGTFSGVVFFLLGALVATPLLTAVAARLLRPVFRQILGLEGRLAADNLARSPGRTGLVVGALAAGVGLVFETAGVTLSSERAVLDWVDQSIAADLFVTANSPVTSGGTNLPMREDLGPQIAALPGVEAALPARFQRLDFRGRIVFVIAVDAVGFHAAERRRTPVPGLELYPALREGGTAIVSDNFAALYKMGAGDAVEMRGPNGPLPLRILGTMTDYSWNRGTVVVDRDWYVKHFDDRLVDVFDVFLKPGADPEAVREAIARRWGAQENLVALTRAELRDNISGMLRRLYGIAHAQQGVLGLVVGLGVVTALLISVLQRRRELGLLRAVGATQAQILRSVLAEALLMGVIGALAGLAVGLPLEWYVVRVLVFDESGFLFPVQIPWGVAGLVAALAVALATLAGLGPAWHALRLRIPDAIAYE